MTNTKTIQSQEMHLNLDGIYATNAQILDGTLANTYHQMVADAGDTNFAYGQVGYPVLPLVRAPGSQVLFLIDKTREISDARARPRKGGGPFS